jgi:DDE superfamily endonuclease
MEAQLLFMLNYLTTSPLHESHAQVFGRQQAQASPWIPLWLPRGNASLADGGELPARKREASTLAEDAAGLFFHDGTERPRNRPQAPEEQHRYYSGKQKAYTGKTAVVIDEPCNIRFCSETVEGKKNDKRLADASGSRVPQGSV